MKFGNICTIEDKKMQDQTKNDAKDNMQIWQPNEVPTKEIQEQGRQYSYDGFDILVKKSTHDSREQLNLDVLANDSVRIRIEKRKNNASMQTQDLRSHSKWKEGKGKSSLRVVREVGQEEGRVDHRWTDPLSSYE